MNRASACRVLGIGLLGLVSGLHVTWAQTAPIPVPEKQLVPGLTYGKSDELTMPKCILFSCSPEEILADGEQWSKLGISAFFLESGAREWSSDIWGVDKKPWTIGASDETFQKTLKANELCKRIGSETFLKISFDHMFEWFNDAEWRQIENNFHQFAIFARDSGCTGMAVDIEYVGDQYRFEWEEYKYDGYTRQDLIKKVHDRMTRVMQAMYDEFPNMIFLTFPESSLNLSGVIHTAWIEEAARRNAPGGVHLCTEGSYRSPNINYMFGRAWVVNDVFHRLLSNKAKKYWEAKCSIAEGIWPFGFDYQQVHDPGMTYDEYRQGFAGALMASSRYMWVYSHNSREQLIGRGKAEHMNDEDLAKYRNVMTVREMVTTPKYVAVAKDLRKLRMRDYSPELGVTPAVRTMGPNDTPSIGLAPADSAVTKERERWWKFALDYYEGKPVDMRGLFETQTHWMLIGPFPSDDRFSGHFAVYPPEQKLDLAGEYDGVNGKVRWTEFRQEVPGAFVNLAKVFTPTEHVTAYALCYVTSPREQKVQVRVGTNDAGKVWFGGKLIFEHPGESSAYLDDRIIPATLPNGTTPILIKVSNRLAKWCFVFRLTDMDGNPLKDVTYSVSPR
ncbi:MAG: hypothetical protein HZB26_21165 [Candidatus Hydrogenedentes bacterium]|nr:hypothetical protein [Candidatus Hydrogenedentota bacterium]